MNQSHILADEVLGTPEGHPSPTEIPTIPHILTPGILTFVGNTFP